MVFGRVLLGVVGVVVVGVVVSPSLGLLPEWRSARVPSWLKRGLARGWLPTPWDKYRLRVGVCLVIRLVVGALPSVWRHMMR